MNKLKTYTTDDEGRLEGIRKDGKKYSVREHRMSWIKPDEWEKVMKALPTKRARITAQLLIQTGARINEIRFIEERDIDYERNTLRLRVTKTKAKKGEKKGKPRTIPISSKFAKELKKYFKSQEQKNISRNHGRRVPLGINPEGEARLSNDKTSDTNHKDFKEVGA